LTRETKSHERKNHFPKFAFFISSSATAAAIATTAIATTTTATAALSKVRVKVTLRATTLTQDVYHSFAKA